MVEWVSKYRRQSWCMQASFKALLQNETAILLVPEQMIKVLELQLKEAN
jgi:hypothetical protein